MRLISSTSDFLVSSRPDPGFPIPPWDNMDGCRPETLSDSVRTMRLFSFH